LAGATAPAPRTEEDTMTAERLTLNVSDELFWDPKIDPEEIAVGADDEGTVTLRGTVGSFRQKSEAERAAERVWGVTTVNNELSVRILDNHQRDDAELRGDVLQALILDDLVPTSVDAKVTDGWVTLTGSADYQYQREEAAFVAGNILGIFGVDNEIMLTETPNAGDVAEDIKKAFQRSSKLDADLLTVDSANGTVTLQGTVRSWSERDDAVATAWASPGVRDVKDLLTVAY
jgi:osmotically-inducible protein OsmY